MNITLEKSVKNRSDKIREYVCAEIRTGNLKVGQRINSQEIADKCNVSPGTVNQSLQVLATTGILNRKPRLGTFVSENADVASKLNSTDCVINAIVPFAEKSEYVSMAKGLHIASTQAGCGSITNGTNNDVKQYIQMIYNSIKQKSPLALVPPLDDVIPVEVLMDLYNSRIPVVTCYRSLSGFGWPMIRTDIAYNTNIAVKHLFDIGRKYIGLIGSDTQSGSLNTPSSYYGLIKEHAFFSALEEHGVSRNHSGCLWLDPPMLNGKMWLFSVIDAISDWMLKHPEMDAICALHDLAAWAALAAASKIGKKVPDDIAIIGNGNFLLFGFEHNDLTTIDMCYEDFGMAIVKLIKQMQSGKTIEPNTEVLIKGKLIKRHSTVSE